MATTSFRHFAIAAAATAVGTLVAGAAPAQAAVQIFVDSVVGTWTDTDPGFPGVTGQGTNRIRWGVPATSSGKSGYDFIGVAPPSTGPYALDTAFNLGTFRHLNYPIYDPTLHSATLEIAYIIGVDTDMNGTREQTFNLTSTYEFVHDETPNVRGQCPAGSRSICDDVVTFALNPTATDSFVIDGVEYILAISGFLVDGDTVDTFLTKEDKKNAAKLKGIVTARDIPVEPVPVPAALPLFVTGLAAIAAAARRRSAARDR